MILSSFFLGIASFLLLLPICVSCEVTVPATDISETTSPSPDAHNLHINKEIRNIKDSVGEYTLKQQIIEKTPVEKLNDIANDITKDMKNNPYYKLPELDRKIREITILHPDVMENLGVYVIPIKREVEETKSNSDSTSQELHDGSITTDDTTQSHIDDLLQNTEMIKAMEPEEKLKYIPQLKHTIVYEILKNRDVLKKLSDKIGEEHGL